MPFKAILRKLVEDTPHASGAVVADWEGEAVEHHCLYDDYELKLLGAHGDYSEPDEGDPWGFDCR